MEITEVRIFPAAGERFRAYVTVTFDDCFMIRDLKIIRGPKGHFVGMPSKRGKDGRYYEIISAITAEARNMLKEKVLTEYEKVIGRARYQTQAILSWEHSGRSEGFDLLNRC